MNFKFGVDYYPEHWPEKQWKKDAIQMQEMGIELVRMGEFSWHKFEPVSGEFCFSWLDEAITILGEHGIKTVLGTPTAAPPAWLISANPQILPVDENGIQKGFGGRHHDCQSNSVYRKYIRRIVSAIAIHYKDNPDVVGWQIDNELGNSHEELCMCDSCRKAFQTWLETKYRSIGVLNQRWGTVFWSQNYDSFQQIPVPRKTPTEHSPSLLLDWKRFCSDLVVDFAKEQIEIIRATCPGHFITHNFMGIHPKTNYFKLSEGLDFVSNDQYPTGYYFDKPQEPSQLAAYLDFMRGLKKKNFWMMELQAGATGGKYIGKTPEPGQLKLWALQCIAHGADTIVFFRWRTCLFGTEQYWHGILPHNGIPGRRYEELKEMMQQTGRIMEDIQGIVPRSQVALLYDYDAQWAFQIQPLHPELAYTSQVLAYYKGFFEKGIPVDFISDSGNLENYTLAVAPLDLFMTEQKADQYKDYVKSGGTLILTMRTGVKDACNVCLDQGSLPCMLEELTGVSVKDYDCLIYGEKAPVKWIGDDLHAENKKELAGCKWVDVLEVNEAQILAVFETGFYQGRAVVTCHSYGKGAVYYVATEPEEELLSVLLHHIGQKHKWNACLGSDQEEGVELAVRPGKKKDYLFVLNHTREEKAFHVDEEWKSIEANKRMKESMLMPYESKIFYREK